MDKSGLAPEPHVYAMREGTLAVWLLEDGTRLREQRVGTA